MVIDRIPVTINKREQPVKSKRDFFLLTKDRLQPECCVERLLNGAAQFVVPEDFSVRPDDEHRGESLHAEVRNRFRGPVAVGPFDAVGLEERFRIFKGGGIFLCQTDELDPARMIVAIHLDEVFRRIAAGASPVGPAFDDEDVAGRSGAGR